MERVWLRKLRKNRGLTQDEVAENCRISRAYYTQIEAGNRRPSPEVAMCIGKFLDFPWTNFFEEDEYLI